jgi:DNA-directed RNA polymerase subunit RPC12/RpoP
MKCINCLREGMVEEQHQPGVWNTEVKRVLSCPTCGWTVKLSPVDQNKVTRNRWKGP